MGDYKKIKRLKSSLNCTKDLKLTLRANLLLKLHCHVDASYAVHVDGKGRTGNVGTLPDELKPKLSVFQTGWVRKIRA